MRRAAALSVGAAAALLALGVVALRGGAPAPLAGAPDAVDVGASAVAQPDVGSPPGAPVGPLPRSLAGTEPAGALRVDASGRFVPGPEALALFDYYFAASGEEPDAAVAARIRAEIRRRLPPGAAAEAEAFFERVLVYRDAGADLLMADLFRVEPERRLQRIRELRRSVFGAEIAAALFGEEEAIAALDLERRRVAQRTDLSPAERDRLIADLDARLPPAEREARAAAQAAVELRRAEAALRAAGAGDGAIAAERDRRVGPEAAARLAELDARRAAWDERVAAYRGARDAIRAEGLAPADEEAALARLRDERFDGPEGRRVEALDRIEAEAARAGRATP
ncbi:MAG TPA: lipase secretion chaperone [Myxococcota bacterium]|nr:lipase secretion chaperone [Myxococcota bacterium]